MNFKNLVKKLGQKYEDLPQERINDIVSFVFQTIGKAIKNNDRVEIRGFGVFKAKQISARKVYVPKTAEYIDKPKSTLPHFKSSKIDEK